MKKHYLAVGFLALAFVLILLNFYFQYQMYLEINNLKAQVLERESEIKILSSEVNSLDTKVKQWQTSLVEATNQFNLRMADIEKKLP